MKLTKETLKRIIKEELDLALSEAEETTEQEIARLKAEKKKLLDTRRKLVQDQIDNYQRDDHGSPYYGFISSQLGKVDSKLEELSKQIEKLENPETTN